MIGRAVSKDKQSYVQMFKTVLYSKQFYVQKKNHPGTKLMFPARLPTSLSTSSEFHSQVRDGLAWFHWSKEHQSISGAKLRRNPLFKEEKREKERIGQNQFAFSISQLKLLLAFHLIPINTACLAAALWRILILVWTSYLDAFSTYSLHAWLPCVYFWKNNRYTIGIFTTGPLVLWVTDLNILTLIPDMDRTVLRRSEPSSRTTFMGEQPNPWDLLQPQDVMSRHRGAKPSRRCELLEKISLLSLE